ncbi:MAG: P-loop NTPase [Symbiobacteriia bacterium]
MRNRPVWLNLDYDPEHSQLFARILDADRGRLVVSVPYRRGRPMPLLPGEEATIQVPYDANPGRYTYEFRTRILQRQFTPVPGAAITAPLDLPRILQTAVPRPCQVVAVASGRGGTGKSTVALNLGLALAGRGRRVSLVDLDLGTANLGTMLGLQPACTLEEVAYGGRPLREVVQTLPSGLMLVPAGAGLPDLADLNRWQFGRLLDALHGLEDKSDVVLLDLSAGISRIVTTFLGAADQVVVVTTPEPHALAGAYALLRVMDARGGPQARVVMNQVDSPFEAGQSFQRLDTLARSQLGMRISYMGHVPADSHVSRAVRRQVPAILDNPQGAAAIALARLAERLENPLAVAAVPTGQWSFVQRLRAVMAR